MSNGELQLTLSFSTLCAAVVLAVFISTLSHGIGGGDSGELVAEAYQLGIAHPPGYPLLTMLMYILLHYIPITGTVAYRANVLSSLFSSAAIALVGKSVVLASKGMQETNAGVALSIGALGFSPLFWQYAITAEVFAMNNFFTGLLLYLTLLFAQSRRVSVAYWGAFTSGLALCNQHTSVLLILPIVCWIFFLLRHQIRQKPLTIVYLGMCFVAGLLPYAYLPYINTYHPKRGSWGHLASFDGFLHHLLRKDYGTFQLYSGATKENEGVIQRCSAYFVDLFYVQGLQSIPVFALLGIIRFDRFFSSKKSRTQSIKISADSTKEQKEEEMIRSEECEMTTVILAIAFLFYLVVFHSLSNLPLNNKLFFGIHQRFWMQPNMLVFFFAGVGYNQGAHFICGLFTPSSVHRVKIGFMAVTVGIAILQLYKWHSLSNQRDNNHFSNYASAILAPLPPKAILLINYDQLWTSLRYMQLGEGFRPDITLINLSMMTFQWFRFQQKLFPHLRFPGHFYHSQIGITPQNLTTFTLTSFVEANVDKYTIFLTGKMSFPEPEFSAHFDTVPAGLTQRFVRLRDSPSAVEHAQRNNKEWLKITKYVSKLPDLGQYGEDTWEWTIGRDYIDKVTDTASFRLMKAIESGDVTSLVEATYFAESALYLETLRNNTVPTFLYKNTGLAHVNLVQHKGIPEQDLPALRHDFFQSLSSIPWPRGPSWKVTCSDRFIHTWGKFLKRKDAKKDPQYKVIKGIYEQALGKAKR